MEGLRHRLLANEIKKEKARANRTTQPDLSDDSDIEFSHPRSLKQHDTGKHDTEKRDTEKQDTGKEDRASSRKVKQESQQSFFGMLSSIIGARATIVLYILGTYLALCCLKAFLQSVESTVCATPAIRNLVSCPVKGELDFKRLTAIQTKLEDVQEQVAGGMSLPLQLKRAEAAIMDASSLAVVGDLPSK